MLAGCSLELIERIKSRKARVGIIGLGYVGFPLAVEFAGAGFRVVGIDVNPTKVKVVNHGGSHIPDVSPDQVSPLVKSGNLEATTDFAVLAGCDAVSICVPTPLNKTKNPDVSFILSASEQIKQYLHPGQLIVLESTTYPGTTEELIRPMLEETGLKAGRDFFLAFSPERVDPGNKVYTIRNTPKVIGASTPACLERAAAYYEQIVDKVVAVSSTDAAEMVKLLENTFRSVNIALVNEVALMCDVLGIDVWEVIDAAASKPFGYMRFMPGPGLGGHCIPIDPHYLSWKLKSLNYYARFIELAGEINSRMPDYVVLKVIGALNGIEQSVKGSRILVLGVAYKKDIDDVRESPALDVIRLLQDRGGEVSFSDPFVNELAMKDKVHVSRQLTPELLKNMHCVVLTTDHSAYDYEMIRKNARLIVDTRNAFGSRGMVSDSIIKL
ncbi:MAG: nucleotide sugar dehydrogenase [Candidatus Glassbacteria bacterium]|nr:nucleotide sugar dehydrogenase [Candidatus Glassbacteria bacterium]